MKRFQDQEEERRLLTSYIFDYLAEKENLLFEVREREWLLNAELEEQRVITKAKLKKGKIYEVKLASVFHFFSTEVYPRVLKHRVQYASTERGSAGTTLSSIRFFVEPRR